MLSAAPLEGFHHQVASVNLADNSLVTSAGTVVRLGDDTQIWYESGNGQLLLPSLAAVAEALAAGHSVLTWGEGIVESSAPLVLRAVHIAFEQDLPPLEAFWGEVDSVNLATRSFVTSEGVVVRLNEDSQIWHTDGPDLHLGSLEDVAQALEDGKTILVQGEGIVESTGPLAILAVHLGWELHQTGFTQPSRDR